MREGSPPYDEELARAIKNYEMHWVKKPLNEVRTREGIPIVTAEELQADIDKEHAPFLKKTI